MIEIAIEARNSARLEQLIARITAKIKKSDAASVGASSASLGSAAIEPYTSSVAAESPNSIPTYNAGLPSLATLPAIPCNSGIPTLPAIPEFPRLRRGPRPAAAGAAAGAAAAATTAAALRRRRVARN